MKKLLIIGFFIITTIKVAAIYEHPQRKNNENTIYFRPDSTFGGKQATGIYFKKQKTAIIVHGTKTYSFKETVTNKTNPSLPEKKHLNPKLTKIGLFSNSTTRSGMPVITYLFGVFDKKEEFQNASIDSRANYYATKQFIPYQKFSGQGLIGIYFPLQHIAIIHDPSENNLISYHFNQAEHGAISAPAGLQLIGSYESTPECNGQVCTISAHHINIYGKLVKEHNFSEN
jgi:hypothetical protein